MVGGDSLDFGGNFKLGGGAHFVVEGDEYDTAFFDKGPKFLHYRPSALLLTAVEFDHADIYRDLDAREGARSARCVALLPPTAARRGSATSRTRSRSRAAAQRAADDLRRRRRAPIGGVDDLRDDGRATRFASATAARRGRAALARCPGAINARNALGVFALARALGLAHAEIAAGAGAASRGVARRQEVVGEFAASP